MTGTQEFATSSNHFCWTTKLQVGLVVAIFKVTLGSLYKNYQYRHISHFHPPSLFLVPLHFSETNISFPSCLRNLLSLYIFFSQSDSVFFLWQHNFPYFSKYIVLRELLATNNRWNVSSFCEQTFYFV